MSESRNPFAGPGKREPASRAQTIVAWCAAVLATAAAVTLFILSAQNRMTHEKELGEVTSKAESTATELAGALAAIRTNEDVIASLKSQVSELQRQKEQVGQAAKTLEEQMREQLESRDVTISKLQGKLTVSIVDRVMFDSGEAVLKPDGAAVMQKIADLLSSHPELQIQVIGHTDNVPIRQTGQSRFASNWELSTARALAAVHFLTEKAGVNPRRVGAVGYGEFRPVADNATAEGRARNRRIAITVLPEELTAIEAPPIVEAHGMTNGIPFSGP